MKFWDWLFGSKEQLGSQMTIHTIHTKTDETVELYLVEPGKYQVLVRKLRKNEKPETAPTELLLSQMNKMQDQLGCICRTVKKILKQPRFEKITVNGKEETMMILDPEPVEIK